MKKRSYGVNPRSGNQTIFRSQLAAVSKSYSFELTDVERAAWRSFASSVPVVNRLGNTTFLSAQQMFTRLNSFRQHFGLGVVTTPPVSTAVDTVSSITCTAIPDPGGSLTITVNGPLSTVNMKVLIWVSPPLNPGRAYVSSLLRRTNTRWQQNVPSVVTGLYRDLFGSLPTGPGQRIFVRAQIVDQTNGLTSPFMGASFIWT